jgi:hypothetical protein
MWRDVCIRAPEGVTLPPGYCFKLKKALYGLRTSPRQWNKRINKVILSLGFKRCDLDPCLYYANRNGQIMLICVYVDDILIAGVDEEFIKLTKIRGSVMSLR